MMNTKLLLERLLTIVGDSDEYFVSGSLSFLPLLGNYRNPVHDVDVAISHELFQTRKHFLDPAEHVRFLTLSEVAIAMESGLARALSPRTGFIHLESPNGLIDLSCYRRRKREFTFSLGLGLTLELPETVAERFCWLEWEGIRYQAGPPELAFIPKAIWCLRLGSAYGQPACADSKHENDMKHLIRIIDWDFVRDLLKRGGLHWLGYRLPKAINSRLDPFNAKDILALQLKL
jgi:hypothetical protein